MDLRIITQNKVPDGTGMTQVLQATDYNNWNRPYKIYDYTAPSNTDASHTCLAAQNRGYLRFPTAGAYTFTVFTPDISPNGEVDDNLLVWLGTTALSGNFHPRNSVIRKVFQSEVNAQKTYTFTASSTNLLVPIRVFYANRLGPGYFKVAITGPGQPQLVSCTGTQIAPDWLPWKDERVGT